MVTSNGELFIEGKKKFFQGEGLRVKGDGGGNGGRKVSHVETLKFLSVLEDHTLLCSWKNPRGGEGEIPISQIGGLRPGADRESSSVTTYWLAKAFRRDSNSFSWAPRRLLSEPLSQLYPPGVFICSPTVS